MSMMSPSNFCYVTQTILQKYSFKSLVKFGISIKKVIISFFWGWSWFRFNNLALALGMTLKFCTSMSKWLKIKVGKFLGANSYVYRSYRGKTGRKGVLLPPPILNRVKDFTKMLVTLSNFGRTPIQQNRSSWLHLQ